MEKTDLPGITERNSRGPARTTTITVSVEITANFSQKNTQTARNTADDVDATLDGDPAARNKHEIIFAYPASCLPSASTEWRMSCICSRYR
jgi:hypothetical protein